MSTSDILSIVSLVVAAFAFIIALLTFLITVITGPRVSILIGQVVGLCYSTEKKHLFVVSYFTFFNGGAQPGALIELSGNLSSVGGTIKVNLFWDKFFEEKNIAKPGDRDNLLTEVTSSVQTIIIPGRAAGEGGVQRGMDLASEEIVEPVISPTDQGSYVLKLTGLIEPGRKKRSQVRATFVIESADHARYLDTCVQDPSTGRNNNMLFLKRQEMPRKNMISRLLIPNNPVFISQNPNSSQLSTQQITTKSQSQPTLE